METELLRLSTQHNYNSVDNESDTVAADNNTDAVSTGKIQILVLQTKTQSAAVSLPVRKEFAVSRILKLSACFCSWTPFWACPYAFLQFRECNDVIEHKFQDNRRIVF